MPNFSDLNSYTFHINLYDLAFIGAIFIGLAFALLLWFSKTINRSANRFLALALAAMVLWMMRILAIDIRLETYLPHWDRLPMQFLLALGPFLYFYVLKITRPGYKFSWKDLPHFAPVLLEQAVFGLQIRESVRTGAATYATQAFQQLNPILQLLIFISVITYLHKSHKLIQNFYRRLQPVLMDRPLLEFRWLRRLLAATALLWCLWLFCAAINYFGYDNQQGIQVYYPFYILFIVMMIWTAVAAFLKPQAAVIAQANAPLKQPVPPELRAKGTLLKKAMETSRYYRDPELSLSSLAEKLNLPPHELSRLINTVFKKSFNDFINEYRVQDMVSKMRNPDYDNMTLLGIAYEAGFNSQSTYNRIFKQFTGKSAAEFKNSLKKDHPSYNLNGPARFAGVISNRKTTTKWPELKLNRNYMFRNYVKIAWRNVVRNKTFSLINISGLALGVACSLLIMLWVNDEYAVDSFYKNGRQLYSVYEKQYRDGEVNAFYGTPGVLADEMKRVLPEVQYATNYTWGFLSTFEANNKIIKENGNHAGPDFFKMFTYHLLEGSQETALRSPSDIAVSKKMAVAFFGSPAGAIGKTIRYENKINFKITAVFDNLPENSTAQFDYVLTWQYFLEHNDWAKDWTNNGPPCYLMLRKGTDAKAFEGRITRFLDNYNKGQNPHSYIRLGIARYGDVYLHSNFDKNGNISGGRIQYVRLFSIVAVFILLIACINFMNLTTARSIKRAKEIGIRKVVGAARFALIRQFIGEALLIVCIAVFFSLLRVATV